MKLTNATEQAVAIVAILATQSHETLVSSETIYRKLSVSQSYIKKLLRKLVVAEIVSSVSGNSGGFQLNKALHDISLYDVVKAIEGPFHSFPDIGVLKQAFAEFDEEAQNGHYVIANFFTQADESWKNSLANISVEDVFTEVFQGYETFPVHDWNLEH